MLKPIVKWAGGKTQLIPVLQGYLPDYCYQEKFSLIEPFFGGGAFGLWMLDNYPLMHKLIINDKNSLLVNVYCTIKDHPEELIKSLKEMQDAYLALDVEKRKLYYYTVRTNFNTQKKQLNSENACLLATWFLFLNRTCFNGLYRENSRGDFNVPVGEYKNPLIYNPELITELSHALVKTKITQGDYLNILEFVPRNEKILFYFDPPYRPLDATKSFTAYQADGFSDGNQKELANFCRRIDKMGYQFILSNSDPKNTKPDDDFFDCLYDGFNINRVSAKRRISSKGSDRKPVSEIIITNFNYE